MIQPVNQPTNKKNDPTNQLTPIELNQPTKAPHQTYPDMSAICWVKKKCQQSSSSEGWNNWPDWTFGGVLQVFWKPIWGDWWVDYMGASNFKVPKNEVHIINCNQVVTINFLSWIRGYFFYPCCSRNESMFLKKERPVVQSGSDERLEPEKQSHSYDPKPYPSFSLTHILPNVSHTPPCAGRADYEAGPFTLGNLYNEIAYTEALCLNLIVQKSQGQPPGMYKTL